MTSHKRYFPELTGVRAVMMYAVFNCHFNLVGREAYGEPIYRFSPTLHDWLLRFTHELAVGVPVFYVLSGFLIYYRYGRQLASLDGRWLLQYVQNRVARIYPVYFLVLLATYYAWLTLPEVFTNRTLPDGRTLLATFTLTQSFFPDLVQAGIPQAWTLTIEETFYFTAPLLFLAGRRFGMFWPCLAVFLVGVLLVNVPIIGPYYGNPHHVFGRTLCGPIGCFGFGAFLAQVVIRYGERLPAGRRPIWTYAGLLGSTLVVLAVSRIGTWLPADGYLHRGVDHGLGAALIFTIFPACVAATFWGLITEQSRLKRLLASRTMVLLGGASYCFYLIHVGALQHLFFVYVTENYLALFAVVNAVAVTMFLLIEKPANSYIKQLGWVARPRPLAGFPRWVQERPRAAGYLALGSLLLLVFAVPQLLQATGEVKLYQALLREDGPYETLQATVCMAAAIAFARAFWVWRKAGGGSAVVARRTAAVALFSMLMMIAMFGEEISWGQRLLGFETPSWLRARNYQGEFTLHNWDVFQPAQRGNRLQTGWFLLVVGYLGVVSGFGRLAGSRHRTPGAGSGRWAGLPLASGTLAVLTLLCFAWYAASGLWSEVIELAVDLLLFAFALELAMAPTARREPTATPWLPAAIAAATAPLLVVFLFQGGEASLPAARSRQLADQGNRHFERGELQLAVARWEQALEAWPRNAAAHWALGQWAIKQKDWPEAEAHLKAVLQDMPEHVEARLALADVWRRNGRLRDAMHLVEEGLRQVPQQRAFSIARAELLLRLGRAAEAIEVYRQLAARHPPDAEIANRLAWYLATLPDDRLRDGRAAVQLAEAACSETGYGNASYLSTLAAAYAEAGQFDDAVRATLRAIDVARGSGQDAFATLNAERLRQYRAGRPLRQSPSS